MAQKKKEKENFNNSSVKEIKKLSRVINPAKVAAINAIVDQHPMFENVKGYIAKHINDEKIEDKFYELYESLAGKKLDEKQKEKYIYQGIANLVASGEALDLKGNEIILKKGLEERTGFFYNLFRRNKFSGLEELNKKIKLSNEIYKLVSSNPEEYSELTPKIMKNAVYLRRANALSPLANILREYGAASDKEIKNFYNKVDKYATENVLEIKKGMNMYLEKEDEKEKLSGIEKKLIPEAYQKFAASILLAFGAILLISNMEITGAAIGSLKHSIKGIIGISLMIISAVLFLSLNKKT